MNDIKQEVRQFYDQVGWQLVNDEFYQNARYEDLRPVSREYINNCHKRVLRHLKPSGRFLLDAGSGPIQYPEYLEYDRGYQYRVCADISLTALQEAQNRIGERGLYVVADIASLPFKPDIFEGVVSLHTIHHLPEEEHVEAYREFHRVLAHSSSAVVVNSWPHSRLMGIFEPFVRLANRFRNLKYQLMRKGYIASNQRRPQANLENSSRIQDDDGPKGTFTSRHDVNWIRGEVGAYMPLEIFVWRSVSVRFLRALIHPRLGGRTWLRLLYRLEERYPVFFGEHGKYPLVVIRKQQEASQS